MRDQLPFTLYALCGTTITIDLRSIPLGQVKFTDLVFALACVGIRGQRKLTNWITNISRNWNQIEFLVLEPVNVDTPHDNSMNSKEHKIYITLIMLSRLFSWNCEFSYLQVHKIVDLSPYPDREAMWHLEVIEACKLFYLRSLEWVLIAHAKFS